MPELPDIEVYLAALRSRIVGRKLAAVRVANPFLVRSVEPPLATVHGTEVIGLRRLGKRIVIATEPDLFLVLHLMIAGRLKWHDQAPTLRGKQQLAAFDFDNGSLLLTEAGTKKRASLYLVSGEAALGEHDPGGVEPLECTQAEFSDQLRAENRTLKRALTNPRMFSGIGNAYSDEILHAAGLSPVQLTRRLSDAGVARLYEATRQVLQTWRDRLLDETGDAFPAKVTAFRDDMAVHGRFGKPCPVCGVKVARIATSKMRPTIVPAARPTVGYSPIVRCPDC